MSGFAVLYREAADHPLFAKDSSRLGAWAYLVLKCCWKPTKFNIGGKIVELARGQICASRSQLAEAWGWSPSAVERFLVRLETEQMIERATGQGRTVITICNYAKYQDVGEQAGQASEQPTGQAPDSHRTTKEQGNKGTIEPDISPNGESQAPARDDVNTVIESWNAVAAPLDLPVCRKLTGARLKSCRARLKDDGLQAIQLAIQHVPKSAFLRGDSGDWNGANIDFLLRPDTVTRILEGKYDDRSNRNNGSSHPASSGGKPVDPAIAYLSNKLGLTDPAPSSERREAGSGSGGGGHAVASARTSW